MLVRLEPAAAIADQVSRAHAARRADARGDAGQRERVVPRHRLAPGPDHAAPGAGRALRVRLSRAARGRHQGARRTVGDDEGFHRPACVGRGLHPGRGLDRLRPDIGPAGRRGPHSARVHGGSGQCGAGHRLHGCRRRRFRRHDDRHAHPRGPARHAALHRRAMERDRRARRAGRRRSRRPRRATHARAASRRSCRSTTWTVRNGTTRRCRPRSANWAKSC